MPSRVTTTLPNVTQLVVADGNWSDNTQRGPIHSITLHTIVGTIQGAAARFNTPNAQVSAHYGVGLDGKLYQWCDEDNVAYHAGNWLVNQTSIGIEHEDGTNPQTNPTGYNNPRPDALYEASAKLVADICKFYDFPADHDHIFRHQDVIDKTVYKGGTACPDALDTDRIIRMANEILNPPAPQRQPAPQPPVVPVAPQTPVVAQPSAPSTPPSEPISTPPTQPVQTPSVPVETPKVDQTDTNTVNNTPAQTATPSAEANSKASGQAGKVPASAQMPDSASVQSFWENANWLIQLLVKFLNYIGIEKSK